jgi:hypothetical protein
MKLTDPSTWFGGGEVTPQAGEELKGLDKRRADAKAKAKQILQGGLDIKAGEERMAVERAHSAWPCRRNSSRGPSAGWRRWD